MQVYEVVLPSHKTRSDFYKTIVYKPRGSRFLRIARRIFQNSKKIKVNKILNKKKTNNVCDFFFDGIKSPVRLVHKTAVSLNVVQ